MGVDGQTIAAGEALKPAPTRQDPKLDPEHLKNDHPQDRFGQARQSQAVREALARGVSGGPAGGDVNHKLTFHTLQAPTVDPKTLPDLSNSQSAVRAGPAAQASSLPRNWMLTELLASLSSVTPENITESVIKVNSMCSNPRLRFIMEHLVTHIHNFAREVSLTTEEWETAIQFLTKVGQISTPVRHEFILLSDVLGLSSLVDSMNHPIPSGSQATESSVLGPFFADDAPEVLLGESIASDGKGEYMHLSGRVLDLKGQGIPDCVIDTWEGDESGFYDLVSIVNHRTSAKPDPALAIY